ncbi:hypothetical protein SAMN04489712_112233 [Thermomonospora echinospora]|uniref:Sulfotransferase family protein n=1 Tax=Thermomonospora echinospora TaxID=1992 RepID=A0A1H6D2J8_9ACTN|nr:hypothetical protein [Thermomonospora echinospora]SEG79542.1 hypothetical protein SAMN04489712_112233 [Thermomonospora echinospora]
MTGSPPGPKPDGARRVFVHIGSPKSGTTFIQQVLWNNRQALDAEGVLLPTGGRVRQHAAVWDLRGVPQHPDDPAPSRAGAWDRLAEQVRESRHPVAVVSEESLASLPPKRIARAVASLAPAEVHVVYTMRDLAGLLPSAWQEFVKHRSPKQYDAWLQDVIDGGPTVGAGRWFWSVHDAVAVLERWSRDLPKERVHVITVPPPGSPRDLLWRRFADVIGVDPDVAVLDGAFANESLGMAETELLRRVSLAMPEDVPKWMFGQVVKGVLAHQVLSRRDGKRKFSVPEDRRAWVLQRQRTLVEGLRAAGYRVSGDLDDLLRPPTWHDPTPPGDREMLQSATDGLVGLLQEIVSLREENSALRRELAEQQGRPLHKTVVHHVSERNPVVMRMRVAYWHAKERIRGPEPAGDVQGGAGNGR